MTFEAFCLSYDGRAAFYFISLISLREIDMSRHFAAADVALRELPEFSDYLCHAGFSDVVMALSDYVTLL